MTKLPHFNVQHVGFEPIYGSLFELIFDPVSTLMSDECTKYELDTDTKKINVTFNVNREFVQDLFMQFSNIMECNSLCVKHMDRYGQYVMCTELRDLTFDGVKFGGDYSGNLLLEITVIWSFTSCVIDFLK